MIICSGTSRLVVIGGEHLPPPGEQRNDLLLGLMLGKPHGLGGEGSQANKVAVVTSAPGSENFVFHFYQVVPQTGQLMDKMECSNAAAAAGLFARLSRVARPKEGESLIHTVNTATNQKVTLTIPSTDEMWKHPWGVRFAVEPEALETMKSCLDEFEMTAEDRTIKYHLVPRGNLFVFCQLAPSLMTPSLALEIARQASDRAIELGRAVRPFLPKIIPYLKLDETHVQTASWFEGERHGSMPGSAGMALGLFLSLLEGRTGRNEVEVQHHSGEMLVGLDMDSADPYTEFFTPVRLLLHGAAPVPPEHSFVLGDVEAG